MPNACSLPKEKARIVDPPALSIDGVFRILVVRIGDMSPSGVTAPGNMLEKVLTAIEWTDSKRSPVGHMN